MDSVNLGLPSLSPPEVKIQGSPWKDTTSVAQDNHS